METKETKRVSIGKIIAISAAVALIAFAAMVVAYKLFKKYFKIEEVNIKKEFTDVYWH